jgi:hypothetical protein
MPEYPPSIALVANPPVTSGDFDVPIIEKFSVKIVLSL